jgi:DNA-directed RNA polymerase specialized sigma24 family protein
VSNVYATQTGAGAIARPQTSGYDRTTYATNGQDAGYELFKRAILLHDGEAWTEISARFRPMLIAWASQRSATGSTDEQADEIADRALARAWVALTPERFGQFPTLAALLAYLRTCVSATAIDSARAQNVRERAYGKLEASSVATPEQVVLDEIERDELWQAAIGAAAGERERVVLVESFQLELPPREILARHPDLFRDIGDVYLSKRHVLGRLQRSRELRRFVYSHMAG